jgi:hypothetical protein
MEWMLLTHAQRCVRAVRFNAVGLASLAALVASTGLAACGGSTPMRIGRQCGSVNNQLTQVISSGDHVVAEECFWQAYVHCQAATLDYDA